MEKRITIDFSVRTVFVVVFSLVIIWLLFYLRDIVALFVISFILATALEPAVNYFQKYKIPRWTSILALYLLVIAFVFALIRLIAPPISTQVHQLIQNKQSIVNSINHEISLLPASVQEQVHTLVNSIPDKVSNYSSTKIFENAFGIFSGLIGAVTVFVIVFYLLLDKNTMEKFIGNYWPAKSNERAVTVFKKMVEKVSLWARGQLILSGSIGIFTFVGLSILGVPYALTLALIAAVTEMLPIVGPYIGAIPALIIAFSVAPSKALWVAILYVAAQQFENHVLVPQVMKRAVGLSPVAIILAILIGAKLLGIIGVILAVPVTAGLAVIAEELIQKGKAS